MAGAVIAIAVGTICSTALAATSSWRVSTTAVSLQGRVRTACSADGIYLALTGANKTDTQTYLYNISTYKTIQLSSPLAGSYYDPCVDGGFVVFQGSSVGAYDDIYLYDIAASKLTRVTDNSDSGDADDWNPRIQNKRVVWEKNMVGPTANPGIYLYDVNTGITSLIIAGDEYRTPDIYGDYVVCVKNIVSGGNISSQIVLYNLKTKTLTPIHNSTRDNENPRIDNGKIAWSSGTAWTASGGDTSLTYQIYLYDIASAQTVALTNNSAGNYTPSIEGNLVSWVTKKPATIQVKNLSSGSVSTVYGSSVAWYDSSGLHTLR